MSESVLFKFLVRVALIKVREHGGVGVQILVKKIPEANFINLFVVVEIGSAWKVKEIIYSHLLNSVNNGLL